MVVRCLGKNVTGKYYITGMVSEMWMEESC